MNGNLEPDERVMESTVVEQIARVINTLGWSVEDEIDVEIGGTSVSGIDVGEVYNKKWQSPIGTRKYNKDAFIIIKNQSRRDLSKSQPLEDFNPRHPYGKELETEVQGDGESSTEQKTD